MCPGGIFEIGDERVLELVHAAALCQLLRRSDGQNLAGVHQRNAVAPLRFVHEVGRKEDRHAFVARQIDQVAPEAVAGDRVDAGGRLVEDQHLGTVQDRDGQLKALFLPQGQTFGPAVRDAEQIEPLEHFLNARRSAILRQVEQMGMQLQVLPDGQFAVERKGLRHVADAFARRHVAGVEVAAEE